MSSTRMNRLHPDNFDRLARISASAAGAPLAIISTREGRRLNILGSYGIYFEDVSDSEFLATVIPAGRSPKLSRAIEYVPNITSWNDVIRLPLLQLAPFVRRLIYVPIPLRKSSIQAGITIGQPAVRWPITSQLNTTLSELAALIGEEFEKGASPAADGVDAPDRMPRLQGNFAESGPTYVPSENQDTAGDFLLGTLNSRTSVRHRGGVAYIVFRTWSARIKSHQLTALEIVKQRRSPALIRQIATEIIGQMERLVSVKSLSHVVPVPCGHSKGVGCFSVDLASEISRQLHVPLSDVLMQPRRSGTSHPRKNTDLKSPSLSSDNRLGNVLLVDDVATSGRHIQLAVKKLEPISDHVTAIAWIGA